MRNFDAFIFRHGVVVNDESLQESAFREVLATYGFDLSHDQYRQIFAGRTDEEGFRGLTRLRPEMQARLDELVELKARAFRRFSTDSLMVYEGVAELISDKKGLELPIGLVSGSHRTELDEILDSLDIGDFFDAIVSADDINAVGHAANPYLLVADLLGVAPERCVSFEHSPASAAQAVAVGCHCVAVAVTHDPVELANAHEVVPTVFEWMLR